MVAQPLLDGGGRLRAWLLLVGAVLAALPMVLACAPIAGPVDVEAIVVNEGVANTETKTLTTPTDLMAGRGDLFDIKGGLTLPLDFVLLTASQTTDYTVEDMQSEIRPGSGADLTPRVSFDVFSDRYVGDDFDSLLYLTLFAHLEDVWAYFDDAMGDESAATQSQGLVGIYGGPVLSSLAPIPIVPPTDNAFYSPYGDAIFVLKVGAQEGVPLAMNPGLVAHEFSHRVFFHNVSAGPAFEAWKTQLITPEQNDDDPLTSAQQNPNTRSTILLRGVDEGLADFFSAVFMDSPRPISASLLDVGGGEGPLSDERVFRDLEEDFANVVTYIDLLEGNELPKECGRIPRENEALSALEAQSAFNPYCLGVLLAKTLWETGRDAPDSRRASIGPAVLRAERRLSQRIADESAGLDRLVFAPHMLLDSIARELTDVERDRFCAQVRLRFASQVDLVTPCP